MLPPCGRRSVHGLQQSASRFQKETRAEFRTVSTHMSQFTSLAKQDNKLNRQMLDDIAQEQLRNRCVSEAGFEAVLSRFSEAASSTQERQEAVCAALKRYQTKLEHYNDDRGGYRDRGQSLHCSLRRSPPSYETSEMMAVTWKYRRYITPIGALFVQLSSNQRIQGVESRTSGFPIEANIKVIFVPPRWLSSVVIEYGVRYIQTLNQLNFSERQTEVSLKHHTINYDPFFLQAVYNIDVDGLRESFEKGLARPTDDVMLPSREVGPWYNVCSIFCPVM